MSGLLAILWAIVGVSEKVPFELLWLGIAVMIAGSCASDK